VPDDSAGQNLAPLWEDIQQRLRAAVPESTFKIWLEPLRPVGVQGSTLYLTGPEGIRTWVERRYAPLLREALAGSGSDLSEIAFAGDEQPGTPTQQAARAVELNPNYTFERFVIGEGNRVAHAAALAVAETPSEAYNPLFLHGPPGLGKTHLLGAIANYLRINAPGLSVRYTTAEGFTNEFVGALRSSGAEQFKSRYRDLDVLLVDDVQFLQGKQHTEEEFFHTFNALYEGGSQLVLSADRLPSELSTLESRLRDRFEWGLTIPVEPPDLPTRLTVLQRLAREAGVGTDNQDALSELARRIDANIRRLHGALTKVIAHASLTAKPLSAELIAELIPNRAGQSEPTTVEAIQQQVAAAFGISRAELVGTSRAATPLRARQVAILLTREATDLSLPQIGRLYGGRLARQVGELRSSIHSRPHDPS
jgi:chromosomal replication initiator protein